MYIIITEYPLPFSGDECTDIWTDKKCKEQKKKCDKDEVKENCAKTCKFCGDGGE